MINIYIMLILWFLDSWLKKMVLKWIQLFPDDMELKHRHICSLALISDEDVSVRIPPKRFVLDSIII